MKTKPERIIDMLRTRSGFDAWWAELSEDVRRYVTDSIGEIIDSNFICTDCGRPGNTGLFFLGDRQLCGPCAERYM